MKTIDRDMIKASLGSVATMDPVAEAALTLIEQLERPVEMLLFCPRCLRQHVDPPMKPHATHLCHFCELLWRPSNYNTVGVRSLDALEPKHFERIQHTNPSFHHSRRRS